MVLKFIQSKNPVFSHVKRLYLTQKRGWGLDRQEVNHSASLRREKADSHPFYICSQSSLALFKHIF